MENNIKLNFDLNRFLNFSDLSPIITDGQTSTICIWVAFYNIIYYTKFYLHIPFYYYYYYTL